MDVVALTRVAHFAAVTVEELPPEVRHLVDRHVEIRVKSVPDATDIARGCTDDLVAYFYGATLDDYEPDDDQCLEGPAPDDFGGAIVLFADRINPHTRERIEEVLLHEIGHFVGFDEEELVHRLGLGKQCSHTLGT